MLDVLYYKAFIKSNFLIIFIILTSNQIKTCLCVREDTCRNVTSYNNIECFNDKIEFHENFRAGHFETLKDGSLIVEYSSDAVNYERFFYGLKENGRYYFPDESPFKHFQAYNPKENSNFHGRYESKNKIVYLSGDTSKTKQYLFSTSIWTTVTELHDLESGTSYYWDTVTFWDIVEIFSYEIIILDLPENNENHYICVFTQHESDKRPVNGNMEDYSITWSIRKFKFDSFGSYTVYSDHRTDYKSNYNSRMISAFVIYDWSIIVIFFLKRTDTDPKCFDNAKYSLAFYNYQIQWQNEIEKDYLGEVNSGNGIFFRAIHLEHRWAAFLFFKDKYGKNLEFEVGELTDFYNDGDPTKRYKFNYRIQLDIADKYYAPHVNFNDFFKIDNKRLAFVTSKYPYDNLGFIIFDLYNNYYNYRIRSYFYTNVTTLHKEIQ
jgi:hypothetical protein